MEQAGDLFSMYELVVGILLPLLISIIVAPDWNTTTKGLVSFGLVLLAAVGHLFFLEGFQLGEIPATVLKILVLTVTTYAGFWKPTGLKETIEKKIGTKSKGAKNTGV